MFGLLAQPNRPIFIKKAKEIGLHWPINAGPILQVKQLKRPRICLYLRFSNLPLCLQPGSFFPFQFQTWSKMGTTEESKLQRKIKRRGFWRWVIASVMFRLLLVYFPRNLNLSSRPEVSTPLTGLRRCISLSLSLFSCISLFLPVQSLQD